ncbi:hypothetical protein ACFRAQ_28010 [Nocardia sp. NPDC056611]|uniref:hypothetical protein n=1 Tax=Nocardia sp. NPDC056611 TaxID=3345877 RepID=UPI0036718514
MSSAGELVMANPFRSRLGHRAELAVRPEGRGIGGVDHFVAVADDSEVEARLAGLALSQPNARADLYAGEVVGVADAEQVGQILRPGVRVVVAESTPARRGESLEIEGQRLLDIGDGDVDVVDH